MIIEGLMCTTDDDGLPHVAPMGPVVDEDLNTWTLRPFQTSTTFKFLRNRNRGVFHVVDDVLPIAQAALGFPTDLKFEHRVRKRNDNREDDSRINDNGEHEDWIIQSSCHWYALAIDSWNVAQPRAEATAGVDDRGVRKPFWGWNRAKHAVLEATILATRLHLADRAEIMEDFARLRSAVEKTAGPREWDAWELVNKFVESS